MTKAQYERKIFWQIFDKKLEELGTPFAICYEMGGEIKHHASVNKKNARVSLGLTIDFLCQEKIVKINIYIENDIKLFEDLYSQKDQIESELGFTPQWIFSGIKNPNTRRIISTFPVKIGSPLDYEKVIDKVVPYVVQYKNVFEKRIPYLFDFDVCSNYTKGIPIQQSIATPQAIFPQKCTKTENEKNNSKIVLPKIDVGSTVIHKTFGEGKILNISSVFSSEEIKYIKVKFSSGEKRFVFPNCFEQEFLILKK